ncbi:response regulator [Paraburkholderia sp. HD33-4]|uniref:response regulator n=1 Tax=Paraburkholderia sp. HD33-4 TaxID=2883242 RepID=UPI001F2E8F2D|nr:response regulator [Paraburkholderia sp. HD33-4]
MKTILVVDDEFDILTVWRLLLERHGYAVQTASNGAVALELIHSSRPGIVVSDCMMPVMSGLQLCAALYADPQLRDIPIILCSAASDIPAQPNPYIAYARKPLSFDQLLALLVRMGG